MSDTAEKLKVLTDMIGEEAIKEDPDLTAKYAVDNIAPKAVIFPKNTNQVSDVVKYANRENLAVVARGSGTKMAMGNPPRKLDLVVCTSRLNHMLDVDASNLTITINPVRRAPYK